MSDEDGGRRKDGEPFAPGNQREDGSYLVGRGRTPLHTRFQAGDGRLRGRRAKGVRNLASDWSDELGERITISEGGKPKRITKQRAVIKQTVARALKGNERASDLVYRHAGLELPKLPSLSLSDREVLEAWLQQNSIAAPGDPAPKLDDDYADQ